MVDYREILRLKSLNYSQRQIAASAQCSRHTIAFVLSAAEKAGLHWPLDESVTNRLIQETFYPGQVNNTTLRREPDYTHIHGELAKRGVTLTLLWSEYCENCRATGEIPYMYTQFTDKYRSWARKTKATMRIQHKPGDAAEFDWAGATLPVYDRVTGDSEPAYFFVSVLPCSCYFYVEPFMDMQAEAWMEAHIHAFNYYGGVPRLLIPDNLKTGVRANTRYDTVLNRSYQELAEYYGTAVVPARVRHPKDKSSAEGSVKFATTWIIAALRNRKFFSINELKEATAEKLEIINSQPFKKRAGNRRQAYLQEEKMFMDALPSAPYEPAVWSTALILTDYTITDGLNRYSVPYDLIGDEIDVRLTSKTVEAFFEGGRVASHVRRKTAQRDPIILPEHMPVAHRKYLSYNADEFLRRAKEIGTDTECVIRKFLTDGREPEQGYKYCVSLLRLADRYGNARMENACARIRRYSVSPTIRNIGTILRTGQDKIQESPAGMATVTHEHGHGITRGAAYFDRKGGVSG